LAFEIPDLREALITHEGYLPSGIIFSSYTQTPSILRGYIHISTVYAV